MTAGRSAFVVGTGRCGTHLAAELLGLEPGVVSRHEADPLPDAIHRHAMWAGAVAENEGLLARKRRRIESAHAEGRAYVESSAYLSLSSAALSDVFGSCFAALVRNPADTVNSLWVKGWYDPERAPPALHHMFSRLTPAGDELERWRGLTRIGKLAWFWSALNARMLAELDALPGGSRMVVRLEDLDYGAYCRVAELVGVVPQLSRAAFEEVRTRRPGAGPARRDVSSWSLRERAEFRSEVAVVADRLGYRLDRAGARAPRRVTQRLRHLFVVDVKRRLINNTPYDVYKLASRFAGERVDVVDLRFRDEAVLPESEDVYLFLEAAGTWMCFDWDPERFMRRLEPLLRRYPKVTVVGPQARALRDLTGWSFEVVEQLDFGEAIGGGRNRERMVADAWLDAARHRGYNGQWLDRGRLRLAPTFSISHTMSCPLGCSFCYYADAPRGSKPDFECTLADLERARRRGHRNFYFMDPNFLRSTAELERLRELYEQIGGGFTYYCQVSPNFLTDDRLERLAASGCCGMVVGIENRARIAAKGSVDEARERVERVLEHGMMPTLFFMIDEENDVEDLVADFEGVSFRYTVLNNAFAGDRSLRSIEEGFEEKRALAARRRDVIARLERRPDFLGPLAATPAAVRPLERVR